MIKYEVIVERDGAETWYKDGQKHRDNDKPAMIFSSGTQYWYKEGKQHRENDKPAVITSSGIQEWFKEGKAHRENGPAIIWSDGREEYWLNGKQVSEEVVMKKKYGIEDVKNMTVKELLNKLNA